MCGIFGTFNMNKEESLLRSCVDKLAHRGPDGEGYWNDNYMWMGHRRLSILDLSINGKQPMNYLDDRYIIIYNGEVYNYIEIRKELEELGYKFHSFTDTEVVVAAFCEWREECLKKFNGMFAFAIWDTVLQRLFIARDRFGVKPLYYIENRENGVYNMAFASEMKALVPLLKNPSYNENLLKNKNTILVYEGTNQCIINEIIRFPAAHYAWIDNDGIVLKKWWNTLDNLIEIPKKYEDQVEMFKELFTSACELRMRSDVPVGTALSGGIDSSAVMSTMALIAKQEMRSDDNQYCAFVATFPNTFIDESFYAKSVVDLHGLRAEYVNIDDSVLLNNIENDMYYFEDVYLTPPCTMSKIYKEMKKQGVKVTIDGHGADELFCGYDMDVKSAFYDAKFNIFKIRSVAKTYMGLYSEKDQNLANIAPSCWKLYKPWMINQLGALLKGRSLFNIKDGEEKLTWQSLDYLNQSLYLRTHENVLPTLLRNYDRYSMMNGVEIRMPFLDYRIVEFAFSIGWQSKIRNGYTKSIVRDSMRGRMPQNVIDRKNKIGFSSPLLEWIRGSLREMIQDMLSSQEFINSDLIDVSETKRVLEYIIQNPKATQLDAEDLWIQLQPVFWKKFFWNKCMTT